ncbi:MAG: hypothetical protein IKN12_02555 [Selenomonadaceae bacterium]|nr:hypothetical protein [Selenomonadaceae bacterium]
METKLAVWLVGKKYAESVEEGKEFLNALEKGNCPDALLDYLKKDLDVLMALGGKVSTDKATEYLKDKLKSAEKLIAFWETNPKDTNAIFFNKRLQEYLSAHPEEQS